jgi:mitochondrial fusion and transport protein UGO1
MSSSSLGQKKRKLGTGGSGSRRAPPSKKFKKQRGYNSDTSDDEEGVPITASDAPLDGELVKKKGNRLGISSRQNELVKNTPKEKSILEDDDDEVTSEASASDADTSSSENETALSTSATEDDEASSDDEHAEDLPDTAETTSITARHKSKRNDPTAFASSLNAILSSNLTRTKRIDPVLSRSKEAATTSKALTESKLELRAKRKLRDERRQEKEKGRVRDVLLGDRKTTLTTESSDEGDGELRTTVEILAQERRLRKTAQRGVVKLFNAVRAAQVRGEEEARKNKEKGVVGIQKREEKIKEMGRDAFLEMVGAGGK